MNKRNYQTELDELLKKTYGIRPDDERIIISDNKKRLLLHCCCAPCSSYVTEYLHRFFAITLFFYNPNITEADEYIKRKNELKRYISEAPYGTEIDFMDADYEPEIFLQAAKGLEKEPERGRRCEKCFRIRLEKTAEAAVYGEFDYFCTTLSISPHKDADMLMTIGEETGAKYDITYLPSDFKKKNGYKRSIELSGEYGLYRQDYCGCIFPKQKKEIPF